MNWGQPVVLRKDMAKRKVNKTELIKAELEKNPAAKPREIAAALKKHKVSAAYVSTIKTSLGKKAGATAKRGKNGGARASVEKVALNELVRAKELADELGGVERAQKLLDAVAQLR